MCIAIVKPQGTEISDEYLENCFDNNKDGAGIAYAKDGKLYIVKGIFDKKQFIKEVRKAEKVAQGTILIHCRIGTSGLKDKNNCHPHIVNDNLVMIHNGILDVDVPKNSKVSDTVIFIETYLKKLSKDFVKSEPIMHLIEKAIGDRNKFAFLNNKGEAFICNAKMGTVEGGIWYSNDTYSYNWDRYDDFFDRSLEEDAEVYGYFEEYIDFLEDEEFEVFGDYPLINKETWDFEPFDEEKYEDATSYITLFEFSDNLYYFYMERYNEAMGIQDLQSA